MSDPGRKSVGDQFAEKITPESQKSTLDKASESASSTYDSVAGSLQPGDSKSTSQKLTDETSSAAGSAKEDGQSYMQQASDMAANVLESAQKGASDLASAISGEKK